MMHCVIVVKSKIDFYFLWRFCLCNYAKIYGCNHNDNSCPPCRSCLSVKKDDIPYKRKRWLQQKNQTSVGCLHLWQGIGNHYPCSTLHKKTQTEQGWKSCCIRDLKRSVWSIYPASQKEWTAHRDQHKIINQGKIIFIRLKLS